MSRGCWRGQRMGNTLVLQKRSESVAHALVRAASAFVPTHVTSSEYKGRDKSRPGTHECVRHKALLVLCLAFSANAQRFVVLGDRTGEAQPGIYEAVWREMAAQKPEFI